MIANQTHAQVTNSKKPRRLNRVHRRDRLREGCDNPVPDVASSCAEERGEESKLASRRFFNRKLLTDDVHPLITDGECGRSFWSAQHCTQDTANIRFSVGLVPDGNTTDGLQITTRNFLSLSPDSPPANRGTVRNKVHEIACQL